MLMEAPREDVQQAVDDKASGIAKTFAKASYVGSEIENKLGLDLGLKAAPTLAAAPSAPGLGGSSSSSPMTHFTSDDDQSDQS